MRLIAKTFFGLERILQDEIVNLGGQNTELLNRAVQFEGDLRTLYRVNLEARTALRILKPIATFTAHNDTVFYKRLRRIDWSEYLNPDKSFYINSTVHSKIFTHSHYLTQKTRDAIVDQFRENFGGLRPSVEFEEADLVIDVHCRHNKFNISIDSSGESLHKRKLGRIGLQAPLNEALAAGIILLSNWDGKTVLYDPMCGSGTLLIEAAMICTNRPPRLSWEHFSFMKWPDYNGDLWEEIRSHAISKISESCPLILGSDINSNSIRTLERYVRSLNLDRTIQVRVGDFFTISPHDEKGVIVTNPPYGKRLTEHDVEDFYRKIGDQLKQHYQGWSAWIFSGNREALKRIGLRTSAKFTLFNGPIESKLHRYDLYAGSHKNPETNTSSTDSSREKP